MPVSADPNDVIEYTLTTDRKKPDGVRPVFKLRFLTERELKKVCRLIKEAGAESDDDKSSSLRDEAIAIGLDGWRNVTHRGQDVATGTPLVDFLSSPEAWELAYAVIHEPIVEETTRKKSLSPAIT